VPEISRGRHGGALVVDQGQSDAIGARHQLARRRRGERGDAGFLGLLG
jgi:hypothetical protein